MSPYINATEESHDSHLDENSSPRMDSPKPKGRILYCRKCEGHGEKVILKNHSPQCPYILCNCKSCEKLNYKRLKSFNKRNKEKIELAAALNAKRHVTSESASSGSVDEEEGHSRRSSFSSSKTSTPGMESEMNTSTPAPSSSAASFEPQASSSSSTSTGLEGRSMSLGAMTVMSYDIWKAKCASEKKRLESERVKKTGIEIIDPLLMRGISTSPKRSPSPTPIRKRAHTFVAQTNRTEDIPVVATKKVSVDERGKGKYILLPTIPAMRIFVNEEEEPESGASTSVPPQQLLTAAPSIVSGAPIQRPSPVLMAPPMMSPFKPVMSMAPQTPVSMPIMPVTSSPITSGIAAIPTMSTEQIISSLTLHNTVLQQQQHNQMIQDLLNSFANNGTPVSGAAPPPPPPSSMDVLAMLRLQQQAAMLAAALQNPAVQQLGAANGSNLNLANGLALPKPVPTTQNLLTSFLQSPIYSNPV